MAPRGFAIERHRGDGYSNKTARECLRKEWKDSRHRPAEMARVLRQLSIQDWEKFHKKTVEAEEKYGTTLTR
jgi:hypothetical protein